jgi:hypothetical protein
MDSSIGVANSVTHTAYENTGISILRVYAQEKEKKLIVRCVENVSFCVKTGLGRF